MGHLYSKCPEKKEGSGNKVEKGKFVATPKQNVDKTPTSQTLGRRIGKLNILNVWDIDM